MKRLGGRHRKAREWGKKDDKLREQASEAWAQTQNYANAFRKGAMKSGASTRTKFYKATHGEASLPHFPGKAILLVALIGLGVLFAADQALKGTIGISPIPIIDPNQFIWQDNLADSSLDGWNQRLATYATDGGLKNIRLTPNSTASAFAITKQPFDLSVTVSKTLEIWMRWRFQDATGCCPGRWGWFLTRNETAPIEQLLYYPWNDRNIALLALTTPVAAGNFRQDVFIQRNALDPVSTGDYGSCETGGTCIFSHTVGLALDTTTYKSNVLALNYTGNPGSAGYSSLLCWGNSAVTCSGANLATVKTFPWLAIQGQSYHLGIWADEDSKPIEYVSSNTASCVPEENPANECSMSIGAATPGTAGPTNPPQFVEPSGVFGPIFTTLFNLVVPFGPLVTQSFGYLAQSGQSLQSAFIAAIGQAFQIFARGVEVIFNAIGSTFGLGQVGTAIISFFTGIANFIANVVTTVFGWGVTFASLFQNGLSFISNFLSGSNGFIAWIISFFTSIAGIWTIIQDLWTALSSLVLPMSAIIVAWWLWGMFENYMSGLSGLKTWFEITDRLVLGMIRLGFAISKEAFHILLSIKQLLTGWL